MANQRQIKNDIILKNWIKNCAIIKVWTFKDRFVEPFDPHVLVNLTNVQQKYDMDLP